MIVEMSDRALLSYVVAVPVYSGPLLPLSVTLLFRRVSEKHFKRNVRLLVVLTSVQAASFLPYVFAVYSHERDALHALFLPFGLGVILFVAAAVYCPETSACPT
jgi:hypothetical protein